MPTTLRNDHLTWLEHLTSRAIPTLTGHGLEFRVTFTMQRKTRYTTPAGRSTGGTWRFPVVTKLPAYKDSCARPRQLEFGTQLCQRTFEASAVRQLWLWSECSSANGTFEASVVRAVRQLWLLKRVQFGKWDFWSDAVRQLGLLKRVQFSNWAFWSGPECHRQSGYVSCPVRPNLSSMLNSGHTFIESMSSIFKLFQPVVVMSRVVQLILARIETETVLSLCFEMNT